MNIIDIIEEAKKHELIYGYIINAGSLYSSYVTLAKKVGYPTSVNNVNSRNKDESAERACRDKKKD